MKKRKIIRLSGILITISILFLVMSLGVVFRKPPRVVISGEPVWTIHRGAIGKDEANAIAVHSRGPTTHVYVAGSLETASGQDNGWIAKYRDTVRRGDTVGRVPTILWEKDLSIFNNDWGWVQSKVKDIALTPAGTYLYVVGSYSSTWDDNDRNIFCIILSADGSLVSTFPYTLDVSDFADEAYGVVIVPFGEEDSDIYFVDIYIIGRALNSFYSSEPPFSDGSIFIAKLRKRALIPELEFIWLQTYDGPATNFSNDIQDSGNDIIYSLGYIYVTGQVNILDDATGEVITAPWVSKVDRADGGLIWEQIYVDTDADTDATDARGNGITKDTDGFLRICGNILADVLSLKYSINGELLSAETGFSSGALSGLPGRARKNVALPNGGVASTGTAGSEIFVEAPFWSDTVDGEGSGNAITTNAAGEIYVAGTISSIDPSTGVMRDNIWIRKYRTRISKL